MPLISGKIAETAFIRKSLLMLKPAIPELIQLYPVNDAY